MKPLCKFVKFNSKHDRRLVFQNRPIGSVWGGVKANRFRNFRRFWHTFEQIICYCEAIYQSIPKILFVLCAKWSYLYVGTNFMILRCWKREI